MHSAFALAPLTLAAVLVFSGLAKLPDPDSTHSMMRLLRLPGAITSAATARLVPWAELVVAALLLTPWRWSFAVGALAATLLFLAFWVIVARAMTFDPRPTCGCFGRVGDHRINARTVARNSVLLALAVVTSVISLQGDTGAGLLAGFGTGDWVWLVLAVALAAVAVLVLGGSSGPRPLSARQRRRLERQRAGQRTADGSGADATTGPDTDGADDYVRSPIPDGLLIGRDHEVRSLPRLAAQQAQLLVLANCWCGSTIVAIEALPAWRERLPQLGVQLVHTLAPWDEPRLARLDGIWWDPGAKVYTALQSGVSPAAVLLGADGLLAGGPVNGVEEIAQFVEDIAGELAQVEDLEEATPDGAPD